MGLQVELLRRKIGTYRAAQSSLSEFVRQAWPIVEPGTRLKWNWHHDAICLHLEAVVNFLLDRPGSKIQNLVINVPPGSTKSTIVSVMLLPWVWTRYPHLRFLTVSHSDDLASRDATKSRVILESGWYQVAWGEQVRFSRDQNRITKYQNKKTGFRYSFGIGSGGTGEHADFRLFDDPHDAQKAMYSRAILEGGTNSYKQKWASRANDPRRSVQICVMQRLNVSDLSAHMLSLGFDHLRIPYKFESSQPCSTSIGWQDPRTTDGELYWPEHQDERYFKEQAINLGPFGIAGQLQQRPVPLSGGMIDVAWFGRYGAMPERESFDEIVQFWDTAQKGNELINSPWVCLTVGTQSNQKYILDVYREWHNYPEGKEVVKQLYSRWRPNCLVIEDKSTGQSLLQELPGEAGIACLPFEPEGDKVTRLGVQSSSIRAGQWLLPVSAPWLQTFELEIQSAPNADYMDQCDALSMAGKWFGEQIRGFDKDLETNTEGWPAEEGERDWR